MYYTTKLEIEVLNFFSFFFKLHMGHSAFAQTLKWRKVHKNKVLKFNICVLNKANRRHKI